MKKTAILYITHNRFGFTRITLPHLLESGGHPDYSVTVVDNASTDGTRQWLSDLRHPRLDRIVLNDENTSLWEVTNQFWKEQVDKAEFLGKVDNDTLMPTGFVGQAVGVLNNPVTLGAVGAIHFEPTDIMATNVSAYAGNVRRLPNGRRVLLQKHLGGCCYLMKSSIVARFGFIDDVGYFTGGWTEYQWKIKKEGHPSAYIYPFMFAKHFDDPDFFLTHSMTDTELPKQLKAVGRGMFRSQERENSKILLAADMSGHLEKYTAR